MRKLILQNFQSPGDIVMLTAAVRDLHRNHPGQFLTDIRTNAPELWQDNPFVTPLSDNDPEAETIACAYPLISQSNQSPNHFIHGFPRFLNQRLGVQIHLTEFKGDIHLSQDEKISKSQVQELIGEEIPFWIIVAGGKSDYTAKWWDPARYQEVIDRFQGRIQFVQVGAIEHYHPELRGVIDLRGATDIRQFVRLMYHAQGVLCPVTFAMHLAAAVETKPGMPKHRPCVVVAGGREPSQWEAYPHHQYIHTNGALTCCQDGGCWKSRVLPLGDGDEKDNPENLCSNVVNRFPRCLDMITAADVVRRIEVYFQGGVIAHLTEKQAAQAREAVHKQHAKRSFSREHILPFISFKNKYRGRTCWVVGRGPTDFDYQNLEKEIAPVFFINDAVALEKHARADSFFFAHDTKQQVWLTNGLKSTAVLPIGGKLWETRAKFFQENGSLVLYRWRATEGEKLLAFSREALAGAEELYNHSGTIHSVIHFIWFCGFKKIKFVGCDGINDKITLKQIGDPATGYDTRLVNLSQTAPFWQYAKIRRVQERLCNHFKLETEYVGTPSRSGFQAGTAYAPKLAHFAWLGGPLPPFALENIERFRRLHPGWDVRVWMGIPDGMPEDLIEIIYSTPDLCMRADVIRYWLLHEFGGLYLDTDVYVFREMNALREHDFFVTRSHDKKNFFNSVLGCSPRSPAAAAVLKEVRESYRNRPAAIHRCHYGPNLFKRLHELQPGLLTILPEHYFYIFRTQGSAIKFAKASRLDQEAMLAAVSDRIADGVKPFAVHTWGIPKELSHAYYQAPRSSWERALPQSDALLKKLSPRASQGLVINDLDGRISAYLLGHHSSMRLTMLNVAQPGSANGHSPSNNTAPNLRNGREHSLPFTGTAFAHRRRQLVDNLEAANLQDGTLDFIVHDLNAGSASENDLSKWLPKLKAGGMVSGPAPEPTLDAEAHGLLQWEQRCQNGSSEWWVMRKVTA